MSPRIRHGALPLLLLLAPVLATGCAPRLELRSSERLDALLLDSSDYPEGLSVDTIDIDDFNGASTSTGDFDSVEPSECEDALGGGAAQLPEDAVEGAGQTATRTGSSSGSALVYSYVLVSGELAETPETPTEYERMVDSCSTMTVTTEGVEFEATISSEDSPSLPEDGGMFVMTIGGEGMDMDTRTAWGQIGDVYFVLVAMDMDLGSDVPDFDAFEECVGDPDPECSEDRQADSDAEADAESAEDFEAVLARAVETLEAGA